MYRLVEAMVLKLQGTNEKKLSKISFIYKCHIMVDAEAYTNDCLSPLLLTINTLVMQKPRVQILYNGLRMN